MAELKVLIHRRGQQRAQITRFKNTFLEPNEQIDSPQFEIRLKKIESLWNEMMTTQEEIELLDKSEGSSEQQDIERAYTEDLYYEVVAKAKFLLQPRLIPTALINNQPGNQAANVIQVIQENKDELNLPIIKLPTFDGDYENWISFRDSFKSMVHDKEKFTNIKKLHYLRSSLKGEAEKRIASIGISADNYEKCWKLLEDRYEDKDQIIHSHIKKLFDLPQAQKNSSQSLRLLLNEAENHLNALDTLCSREELLEKFIIHMLSTRLDYNSKLQWESETDNQTIDDIKKFLNSRCKLLEKMNISNTVNSKETKDTSNKASSSSSTSKKKLARENTNTTSYIATTQTTCPVCKSSHNIYNCEAFLKMSIPKRSEEVKKLGLCFNCLRNNHLMRNCKLGGCKKCQSKHNTLLHQSEVEESGTQESNSTSATIVAHSVHQTHTNILLSTVVVEILDNNKKPHQCRALLDSGSQSQFITQRMCDQLQISLSNANIPVLGIAGSSTHIKKKALVTIKSRYNSYSTKLSCLVITKITDVLPTVPISTTIDIPSNIDLADPLFYQPAEIDLLLGAGIFWDLIRVGQLKLKEHPAVLQKTVFGWVISGQINTREKFRNQENTYSCNFSTALEEQVALFWKQEDCSTTHKKLSKEEQQAEDIFSSTVKRNAEGRFIVTIPFKQDLNQLGSTYTKAKQRLGAMERKFLRNPEIAKEYYAFMDEYLSLGHMSKVDIEHTNNSQIKTHHLPHHAVKKEGSHKALRVVFDGSVKTDSGQSINDLQIVGPTIQDELFSIILRFRQHKYVMTADITKMYRQVLVNKTQTHLQRILWRKSPNEPISEYKLNTITYGTSSAPFLAIRCLKKVAEDNSAMYEKACKIIERDFYVDDLLTGDDNLEDLQQTKREITMLLSNYGFPLRKWNSNIPSLTDQDASTESKIISDGIKALGIYWHPKEDTLRYSLKIDTSKRVTKREILSIIAQIFDPLGLLGPVIVIGKIILQFLWKQKLSWDETVPLEIHTKWIQYCKSIQNIPSIQIPRKVIRPDTLQHELHGFSDASESAFGACVYIRSIDTSGQYHTNLLCAKSKVAPLKTQTIPRLELCGALLLTRLTHKVITSLTINISKIYLWTDSSITKHWITSSPHSWKIFIANRTTEIQELLPQAIWKHVPGTNNPADIISRGIECDELKSSQLWWYGPSFLQYPESQWPTSKEDNNVTLEQKSTKTILLTNSVRIPIFDRYSSITKLRRVIAWCFRFINNSKVSKQHRVKGQPTVQEMKKSLTYLVKAAQQEEFQEEFQHLKIHKCVSSSSRIASLHPFLDKEELIRVGGRLKNANIPFDEKHQLLLPAQHKLTKLIMNHAHVKLLHAGQQALLASIRKRYWPLSGVRMAKQIVRSCIKCIRAKPKFLEQIMGNLPQSRITPSRPFTHCGIDFAGPFLIKDSTLRNQKIVKTYMCLFVCFSTKAIHLELASDLSTDGFLMCLRRFFGRRGKCRCIYSDNGTNFIGAKNELSRLTEILTGNSKDNKVQNFLTNEEIEWKFIPPRAPHFGGIWESGVKAAKTHLIRVLHDTHLTYEQLYTVMVEVEACLNSRPLTPMSSDPNDESPLTPGHFLIGTSLTAMPQQDVRDIRENRLNKYQRTQQLLQHFWSRWQSEYLQSLQQRNKWKFDKPNLIHDGSLVVIKEDNLPPLKWRLGRIIALNYGKDGVARVATIRTAGEEIKRPITRLCLLPHNDDQEE